MPLREYIFQDWLANKGSKKARFVVSFYRLAQVLGNHGQGLRFLATPVLALYEILVVWILKIEIRYPTRIGPGLRLVGCAVAVIHQSSVIGKNCGIGNCVTVGEKHGNQDCPKIGNGVSIGANSVVIGPVMIGDGATIEPGSVVIRDVPASQAARVNPARHARQVRPKSPIVRSS